MAAGTTSTPMGRSESIEKLRDLIKGIKIAMLTTAEEDGTLRSRPMATQQVEFDGDLWFFTKADSPKVAEARRNRLVNVSYAAPDDQRYVSVSGTAELVRDPALIHKFWNPIYKAWFPDGPDDPEIALMKIHVDQAEYWESPSGKVVQLVGFVKALATGQPYNEGENKKLDLDR